jgi:hypothetical protein
MEAAVPTKCRSAPCSQTAAAAARQHRRQLSQLLVQQMGMGIRIKTPTTKMFRKINKIKRTIKDKVTLIMAGTTAVAAAAVPTMTKMFLVHVE